MQHLQGKQLRYVECVPICLIWVTLVKTTL